jgi:hypothetical protein
MNSNEVRDRIACYSALKLSLFDPLSKMFKI